MFRRLSDVRLCRSTLLAEHERTVASNLSARCVAVCCYYFAASVQRTQRSDKFRMRHLVTCGSVDEVAKAASIRGTAETLNITPSALNRRILALEEEPGVPIFERLPHGVRVSTAGEALIHHVGSQMSDMLDAARKRHNIRPTRKCSPTVSTSCVASRRKRASFLCRSRSACHGWPILALWCTGRLIRRISLRDRCTSHGCADARYRWQPHDLRSSLPAPSRGIRNFTIFGRAD